MCPEGEIVAIDAEPNIQPTLNCYTDWLAIATEIELNYSAYDGFIVLHGTDTMCYTSSALSFLLEDLGKTVVRAFMTLPYA